MLELEYTTQIEYARNITYTRTESGSLRHNVEIDLDRIYRAVDNHEQVYLHGRAYLITRIMMSPNRNFTPMIWNYYLELEGQTNSITAPAEHVKFTELK